MIQYCKNHEFAIQLNCAIPNKLYIVSVYYKGKRLYKEFFSSWESAFAFFDEMRDKDYEQQSVMTLKKPRCKSLGSFFICFFSL